MEVRKFTKASYCMLKSVTEAEWSSDYQGWKGGRGRTANGYRGAAARKP